MKIDSSKKYASNPRRITDEQLAKLRTHLETLGDLSGVVYCTKNKAYLGGNQRSEVMDGCEIEITERFDKATAQKTLAHGFISFKGEKFAYREVAFSKKQFQQACIVANAAGGDWDLDALASGAWSGLPVEEWGLDLPGLDGLDLDADPNLADPNFNYQSQYGVIVKCDNEKHQQKVFDDLTAAGYDVKVVVV